MDDAFAHIEGNVKRSKKELIPPDGGWGYFIVVSVGFTCMFGFGSLNAFGILFNNFFLEQGSAGGLPLVIGVYNGTISFAGFLSGIALKRYSFRQLGLLGAALFVLGDILTIFALKTYQLALTFGVIRGAGFGIMISVSLTAFNCYFTKKRTAMMSANQTMTLITSIIFPMLVTFLLSEYGFRWTLTLIMAIDLHLVFAMLVMHPVEWHMVKSTEPVAEIELPLNNQVMDVKNSHQDNDDESVLKILPGDEVEVPQPIKKDRRESIQKSIIKIIYENMELDLLKDPRFVCTIVGIGFTMVSDVTYVAMEPMLLFSYGFSEMEVATCVMVGAVADLMGRFSFGIFSYFFVVNNRKLFFIGTCITVVLRIALVSSSDLWYVFSITALSGLVRCTVQVLCTLVLLASAPDRFPAAFGLYVIFTGVQMLMANALIGVLYDSTGSYLYCFLAMSICCLVCIVLWTIEYFVYRINKS